MEALNEHFGTAAELDDPKGGIFLWAKLPDAVAGRARRQTMPLAACRL
jgi:DNA-binding transcriptional MocR family regulator